MREEAGRRCHEVVEEVVVPLAPDPRVRHADVDLTVEQAEVVGAHIEDDRDDPARMDAGRRRVDRSLADGDLDATDALVADAEDAFGVGDDDQVDLVGAQAVVEQRRLDALGVVDREEDTPGTVVFVTEALDGLADRRRVDDRQHLLEIARQEVVEEHLVAVAQLGEMQILRERRRPPSELLIGAPGLLLHRRDAGGHQADEPEGGPLLVGEGRASIGRRIGQHGAPARLDANRRVRVRGVLVIISARHRTTLSRPRRFDVFHDLLGVAEYIESAGGTAGGTAKARPPRAGTGPTKVSGRHTQWVCRVAQLPVSFSRSAARASSEASVPSATGAAGRAEPSEPASEDEELSEL